MAKTEKPKSRLGRGLSSLISVSELPVEAEVAATQEPAPAPAPSTETKATEQLVVPSASPAEIPLDEIRPNPYQPRKTIDEAKIAELAASLKSTGLVQPIIVRKVDGAYQLIAGERRWRAAKRAGLATIPAFVRDVDSFTQAQMALIENVQREDLNPIERAQGYRALIDQLGLTQSELAIRMGEERSSIANFLRLLDLAEPIKTLVRDGKLSFGHAKLLAGVQDVLEQERLANLVVTQDLSVRNLERLLQQGGTPETSARTAATPSAHLQDLEKSLSRQLGMRVQLRAGAKKGKGRLVIHYTSLDQFDELLGRLGVTSE